MALPATDSFDRTNSTSSLGASWTVIQGVWGINANTAYPNTSGGESGLYWNADTFGNDQYSQAVITRLAGGAWAGLAVRGSAGNYYGYYTDGGSGYLFVVAGGSWAELGTTDSEAWAVSDVMRLEVEGTTLRIKRNGATLRSVTNGSLSAGAAGLAGYGGYTVGSSLDTWEGGDLGGAPAATGLIVASRRRIYGGTLPR